MTHNAKRISSLCLVLLLVTGCASGGASISGCTAADTPIRLSSETIDTLTDDQVKTILNRNEELADRGCAKPNR